MKSANLYSMFIKWQWKGGNGVHKNVRTRNEKMLQSNAFNLITFNLHTFYCVFHVFQTSFIPDWLSHIRFSCPF